MEKEPTETGGARRKGSEEDMKRKLKSWLALCLAAALLLGLTPVFAAKTAFSDVPAGSWYEDAVAAFAGDGIVKGVSETRFAPDETMTRAMAVTILHRMSGGSAAQSDAGFADVAADSWYAPAVAWAKETGVTDGVGDGRFAPDGAVTREQLATLLWRYAAMHYENDFDRFYAEEAFSESDPVSDWAQDAMRLSIGAGVIKGRGTADGTRWDAPDACTRAEAVTMLHRFAQLELTDKEPEAVFDDPMDALADCSLKLFTAMRTPGENTVASPLSVICALGMLYQGATDETAAQLKALFGMDAAETADTLAALTKQLPDSDAVVRLANAMWVEQSTPVKPEFLKVNQEKLGAEVFRRAFTEETLDELNGWVSEQTDGMIPSILSQLPPDAALVLLNALLFKGHWAEFYTGTTPMDFHASDGTVQRADMLRSIEHIYLHDESAAGFRKGFSGGKYAFAVIVPNEGVTPDEYLKTLDGAELRALLKGEVYDEVITAMPKFTAEFRSDLTQAFARAGLTDLNHLDGIAPGLFVSDAVHKAVIDVNEDGVSAAAVTAVVPAGAAIPHKTATVIADRPYLYMIVDKETMLPLFIGVNESVG